ncbi:hypothetical protein [Tunicatimonas pelagia]|uniref:hypothetical protein n=1 Tax=Tunicatimonas pelagia TaxID=931531 RepID=UPI002666FEE5|nr:hypothetical protein [Tunicatimonas pelagia]WKN45751.1 hypothetical protein P0M28_12365 [Tunicatimonas pelagia]
MKLSPEKLSVVYERTALEEIAEKYRSEDYEVILESQTKGSGVDMIARRGDETILIEAIIFHRWY